jgi:oxygen-independent coproporphyrinogen-3 oxidase
MSTSLYIHIPFCKRRCFYCDFPITTGNQDHQTKYVEALITEIQLTVRQYPPLESISTIFLGGGTPSLLAPHLLTKIFSTIRQEFTIAPHAEITLEANPDSLEIDHLFLYRELGINRISLGVQAFQPHLLALCGRDHTPDQIYAAVSHIQQAGFTNFSLDLISGLPTQTLAEWAHSLNSALALKPTHLSIYDLIIEENTAFFKRYQQGRSSALPPEELTVEMYKLTRQKLLENNYLHYEISNFAKAGFACLHNRNYWLNRDFYGVGMGATSYLLNKRYDRPRKFRDYLQMVADWSANHQPPSAPTIDTSEILFDTLMQGLRLAEGLDINQLKTQFGGATISSIHSLLKPFIFQGWVHWQGDHLYLSQPEGWLFSDQVIAVLYDYLVGNRSSPFASSATK